MGVAKKKERKKFENNCGMSESGDTIAIHFNITTHDEHEQHKVENSTQ